MHPPSTFAVASLVALALVVALAFLPPTTHLPPTVREHGYGMRPFYTLQGMARKKSILSQIDFDAFAEALGKRESSGNYLAVNRLGYVGKYQFGAAALKDIGFVRRSASNANSSLRDPKNWTIEGGLQVFLSCPPLQDDALKRYCELNAQRLERYGLLPKEAPDIAGLLAAAHLGGTGSVRKWLEGDESFQDANGTKLDEYVELGIASQQHLVAAKETQEEVNEEPSLTPFPAPQDESDELTASFFSSLKALFFGSKQ